MIAMMAAAGVLALTSCGGGSGAPASSGAAPVSSRKHHRQYDRPQLHFGQTVLITPTGFAALARIAGRQDDHVA